MHSHKYLQLLGEVIFRGSPTKIPGKYYDSTFFAIKITLPDLQTDGSYRFIEDCFNIHTFKKEEIYKIRVGYIVSCLVRRDGKLWMKEGEQVLRYDMRTRDGEKINIGQHPVDFESYHLVKTINIVDDSINKEAISSVNKDFQYFLDDYE